MRENQPADKSLAFSLRIVNLNQYLVKSKQETILSKQMLRSGIGEANYSQTKTDFVMKQHAALKATAETEYRIRLLGLSEYIDGKMCESILQDCRTKKEVDRFHQRGKREHGLTGQPRRFPHPRFILHFSPPGFQRQNKGHCDESQWLIVSPPI